MTIALGVLALYFFSPEIRATDLPPFKSLRYDEDYRFLALPATRDTDWTALKYIPFPGAGYLSIGGEARERFESYRNEFFSQSPNADNAYLLERYLLHVDYHPTEGMRLFAQLQSSLEDGRAGGPRATDRDDLDLHELFAQFDFVRDDARYFLRLGRQEMAFGSERLVSVREGPNNRRAFDAVRLTYADTRTSISLFYSSPVEIDRGSFDDQHLGSQRFWGAYATVPLPSSAAAKLDFYYLGFDNAAAVFDQRLAPERRETVGLRVFGSEGPFDFNHEVAYQFGSLGSAGIDAWGAAAEVGVTFKGTPGTPRLAFKAAVATGERDAHPTVSHAHSPLFPRGNYFTEAGLLGPKNFFDAHPSVRFQPRTAWTVESGVDLYWRQSLADGSYSGGGVPVYPGNPRFSRFVGTDWSTVADWQVTSHLKWSFGYTHFFPGAFVRQSHGVDVDYYSAQVTFRF